MIIARKYRLTTLVCLALLGVAQASATGVGKTASEKLEATAIHSLAAAEQVALGAPPGTSAASNDTLYLLSLLPPWVELQDIDRVDFILPVIIEGENVATVFALDADIFWFQQGEEPLVLPPTGLEPPLRLLVADILPGAGNELIVAGGASMVAGSMPPSNWTPVGADAPGRIDAVPDESNDLLFFAAINGDLWLYDQETASWQAGLTFDGQPDQITALAAPLLAHSFLLAWDGSVLHGLHLEPDGAEGLNLIWKPFPVQPSFTVLSLSVLSGMFGNASGFATSGDSVFIINLSEADSGVGWKGPFTDAREITAMTRWQDPDSGQTLLATGGTDGLLRMKPLVEDPEAPFQDFGAPPLRVIRGLATRDDELIALDCCARVAGASCNQHLISPSVTSPIPSSPQRCVMNCWRSRLAVFIFWTWTQRSRPGRNSKGCVSCRA